MNLDEFGEESSLRQQIRSWLAKSVPEQESTHPTNHQKRESDLRWQRLQYDAGWAGVSWPEDYGGRGLSTIEQLIWYEEYARAKAPHVGTLFVALYHAGPTLIANGSSEQKAKHLPKILRGEEVWCQGFSEPGAGSDLAGIETRGEIDGDHVVINGRKIWTSYADISDYQELLIRTGPRGAKHDGLTWVICDMNAFGVSIQPIATIDGGFHFCEVVYEDVRLPLSAVVGEVDDGWRVAMSTLEFERGAASVGEQVMLQALVTDLLDSRRDGGDFLVQGELRNRLKRLDEELLALRAMAYLVVSRSVDAGRNTPHGSMIRLRLGELYQEMCNIGMLASTLDDLVDADHGRSDHVPTRYMYSRAKTIASGTKDIQRDIIGERVLGLPRSRDRMAGRSE